MINFESALSAKIQARINQQAEAEASQPVDENDQRQDVSQRDMGNLGRMLIMAKIVAESASSVETDVVLLHGMQSYDGWKIQAETHARPAKAVPRRVGLFRTVNEIELSFGTDGTILTREGVIYTFYDADGKAKEVSKVKYTINPFTPSPFEGPDESIQPRDKEAVPDIEQSLIEFAKNNNLQVY